MAVEQDLLSPRIIPGPVSGSRLRLFLPFGDDDPKTAEVLAKLLMLVYDGGIRNPAVLDQLKGPS